MPLQIAIAAGEESGDRLGAGLITAIKQRAPRAEFIGVGGGGMREAGCELLFDIGEFGISGVIGFDGLIKQLPRILSIRRALVKRFTDGDGDANARPDIFIGIDAPDFNIGLARKLKRRRRELKCIHYVSPTVWAWRGYRIHKIRRAVDLMLTLFPFEAEYYRRHGVAVDCVGHPMADEIGDADGGEAGRAAARAKLGLAAATVSEEAPVVALLPGSRRSEIRRLAVPFLQAARLLLQTHPNMQLVLPFANDAAAAEFETVAGDARDGLPLLTTDGDARTALAACDVAILASGTAALEAALLRRPHIVAYKLAAASYWLMRRLRRVEYYSMPNQLLPKPMVTELIQRRATAVNIARETAALLAEAARRAALARAFAAVHHDLRRGASARAADAVLAMAGAG